MTIMSKTNLAYKKEPLTDADYLRIERQAFEKSEFIGGEIVARKSTDEKFHIITSNLFGEIGIQTKKTTCRPFSSDMRVKAKKGNYYYPDLVVACGERKFEDNKRDVLLNPKVIIEVLSKSTRLKDRNEKLDSYMSVEGLTDYVFVEHTVFTVLCFGEGTNTSNSTLNQYTKTDKNIIKISKNP